MPFNFQRVPIGYRYRSPWPVWRGWSMPFTFQRLPSACALTL